MLQRGVFVAGAVCTSLALCWSSSPRSMLRTQHRTADGGDASVANRERLCVQRRHISIWALALPHPATLVSVVLVTHMQRQHA